MLICVCLCSFVPLRTVTSEWLSLSFQCFLHKNSTAIDTSFYLSVPLILIELPDSNLGIGGSGTQASGGAVVPKGANKRRAG